MQRRHFLLQGSAVVATAPLLSGARFEDWTHADVARFQLRLGRRMVRFEGRTRRRLATGGPLEDALARAGPALYGVHAIGSLPPEVQAHPDLTEQLHGLLARFGRAIRQIGAHLRRHRDEAVETLEAEPALRGDIAAWLSSELHLSGAPGALRSRTHAGVDQFAWSLQHRPVGTQVDEVLARLERLERLAERPEAARAALHVSAPAMESAIRAGRARWGSPPAPIRTADTADVVLASLVIGLGIVLGVPTLILGIATLPCPCVGIPLILLGATLIAAGILIGKRILESGTTGVDVFFAPADAGWVDTGVDIVGWKDAELGGKIRVDDVSGVIRPAGHPTLVAGDGAPLPGAPLGVLVARYDGGGAFRVSGGLSEGQGLQLAANLGPTRRARGRFRVQITR